MLGLAALLILHYRLSDQNKAEREKNQDWMAEKSDSNLWDP